MIYLIRNGGRRIGAEAEIELINLMAEIADYLHKDIVTSRERQIKYLIDGLFDKFGNSLKDVFNSNSYYIMNMYGKRLLKKHITDENRIRPMSAPYVRIDNFDEKLLEIAEQEARMVEESFIAKQSSKLEGVIKGRKIIDKKIFLFPNLQGDVWVKLEDGSSFVMHNTMIVNVSSKGRLFNQFPTRFSNVIFADGIMMKSPSEAKMKKDF